MEFARLAGKKSPDVKTPGDFVKALISSNTNVHYRLAELFYQHYPISGSSKFFQFSIHEEHQIPDFFRGEIKINSCSPV